MLLAALPTREEGAARQQLCQDAAQAPHVDGHLVRQAQDDLRAPVEAALDVCVYTLRLKAAASKVDDLHARVDPEQAEQHRLNQEPARRLDEHVLMSEAAGCKSMT